MAKLFKRGRIWYAWVRKRGGGVRKITTLCTDKRAAETVLAQLEREAVDPAFAAASKTTSQHVLDEYLRSRQRVGRSEATVRYVRTKAAALVGLLPKLAGDITHPRMSGYVDTRLKEGAMRTTIRKELGVLKAALKLAKKNGEWLGDPDSVIPDLDDDYEPRSRALDPWELVGLASVLPPARAAHVAFIVATGARWGESVRARSVDVMADCALVLLRGTKTKAAHRTIPLSGPRRLLLRWALERSAYGVMFEPWLNVRRDLVQACAKLGIAPVSPNDLRRTFGTWLRNAGVEPQLIGAAMGHTDSRMVERVYGRLTPEALGKLLEERTGTHETSIEAGRASGRGRADVSQAEEVGVYAVLNDKYDSGRGGAVAPHRSAPSGSEFGHARDRGHGARIDPQGGGRPTGLLTGGTGDFGGASDALPARSEPANRAANAVRRGGVEPPTRGFSGHAPFCSQCGQKLGFFALEHLCHGGVWDANGRHLAPSTPGPLFCAPWVESAARALLAFALPGEVRR